MKHISSKSQFPARPGNRPVQTDCFPKHHARDVCYGRTHVSWYVLRQSSHCPPGVRPRQYLLGLRGKIFSGSIRQ